jgi:hypothetical protein
VEMLRVEVVVLLVPFRMGLVDIYSYMISDIKPGSGDEVRSCLEQLNRWERLISYWILVASVNKLCRAKCRPVYITYLETCNACVVNVLDEEPATILTPWRKI